MITSTGWLVSWKAKRLENSFCKLSSATPTNKTAVIGNKRLQQSVAYAENHQTSLQVFLNGPDVQMDTSHLERLLRCIPMGRKNWMFCWTETGTEHIAIIQSLLVSCRLQDIDPYKFLVDVLQRVSLHPGRQIDELIPRNWKDRFGKKFVKSASGQLGRAFAV